MTLTGSYQHTIDAKGRLFIPAKLREELGDVFYLAMGMDGCLAIYPETSWEGFMEKLEQLPTAQTRAMRTFFANTVKCELDSQGRILVPQKLRTYAKMEKEVIINGAQNRVEIWNAESWNEMEDLSAESLLSVMKALGL
ncbi:MAG: division/cell wall cluster transcriptional repressor MraZ [Oscillospiraceae bacterium]|nr:division/cell wall cluster transcriptional repressor MraZ [Oscillospiraceae bacterium]